MHDVKIYSEGGTIPYYATDNSAGFDLVNSGDSVELHPGCRAIIPTGLYMQLPVGTQLEIRPRSGLAAKQGVTVLNTPGTIDADYRGEIKVILINTSDVTVSINSGDRIAQGVLMPYLIASFVTVQSHKDLSATERGAGGFGHTGK